MQAGRALRKAQEQAAPGDLRFTFIFSLTRSWQDVHNRASLVRMMCHVEFGDGLTRTGIAFAVES
jgi:hypothetical protein